MEDIYLVSILFFSLNNVSWISLTFHRDCLHSFQQQHRTVLYGYAMVDSVRFLLWTCEFNKHLLHDWTVPGTRDKEMVSRLRKLSADLCNITDLLLRGWALAFSSHKGHVGHRRGAHTTRKDTKQSVIGILSPHWTL